MERTDDKKDDPVKRELRDDKNKVLKLEFVVHIKAFESLWSPAYSLTLKPIPIERIDILESRLLDVEDEVVRCSKVEVPSTLSEFTTSRETKSGQSAIWSARFSDGFAVESNGSVRALMDGTYVAALQVPYYVACHGANVALAKGGQRMVFQTIYHFQNKSNNYDYYGNRTTSGVAAVSSVVQLKAGETFAVNVCSFRMEAGAKMVIAKMVA